MNILVIIFIVFSLFNLKGKNILLQFILSVLLMTEIIVLFLNYFHKSIVLLYSISFIFHNSLWILMINKFINISKILIFYIFFCFINLFFIEGLENLNYNIFIFGSLIYLATFVYLNYKNLIIENFNFFKSNDFLLIFAPVLFFLGFSLIFAFRGSNVFTILIYKKIDLYMVVNYFVNIIYYFLIMVYSIRERKLQYA